MAKETGQWTFPTSDDSWWEVVTDGSSSKKGSDGGIVVTSPKGFKVYYTLVFQFTPINNEAEYEAFVTGLHNVKDLGEIRTDFTLVAGQVLGNFEVKGDRLARYKDQVVVKIASFQACMVEHVPRTEYTDANMLFRLVHEAPEYTSKIAWIIDVPTARIDILLVALVGVEEENWITNLHGYIESRRLPEDEARARNEKLRAPRFQVIEGWLYCWSYDGPLMRCLTKFEANLVMTELHSGLLFSALWRKGLSLEDNVDWLLSAINSARV